MSADEDAGRPRRPRGSSEPVPAEPRAEIPSWPRSIGEELVTHVYLTLVRRAHPSRASLISLGFLAIEIDQALPVLEELRLIDVGPEGHINVYPPDVALPAFAAELERQARTSRGASSALATIFYEARTTAGAAPSPETFDLRLLESIEDIDHARVQITPTARQCITRLVARTSRHDRVLLEQPQLLRTSRTMDPDLPPGMRMSVFEASVLELEGALTALRALQDDGVDVRLTASVPFTLVVVDETAALMDISNIEPSGYGSVMIRHGPLVQAISGLAAVVTSASSPVPRTREPSVAGFGFDQRDHDVLSLLAAGASDSVIARKTGVSQRTVERRVRSVMDQLGVATRFQAGVEAARRGLV
ncbi:MAG TPA: LuxR C-terminal-related transcriptional regulator [Dermatophilaceae bacterium]|nr:LuxR C-terminal-related transcriptional regulator [Dermatophilaceae bacterium]